MTSITFLNNKTPQATDTIYPYIFDNINYIQSATCNKINSIAGSILLLGTGKMYIADYNIKQDTTQVKVRELDGTNICIYNTATSGELLGFTGENKTIIYNLAHEFITAMGYEIGNSGVTLYNPNIDRTTSYKQALTQKQMGVLPYIAGIIDDVHYFQTNIAKTGYSVINIDKIVQTYTNDYPIKVAETNLIQCIDNKFNPLDKYVKFIITNTSQIYAIVIDFDSVKYTTKESIVEYKNGNKTDFKVSLIKETVDYIEVDKHSTFEIESIASKFVYNIVDYTNVAFIV